MGKPANRPIIGISVLKKNRTYRKVKYIFYRQTLIEPIEHLWTFIGAFLGIGIIGWLQHSRFTPLENFSLIGSFGASAVLVYGATNSPLAQPKNLVGGHLISAIIGVTIAYLIPNPQWNWLACALAVSLSIVAMQMTKTLHPPGGATALIANIGTEKIKALGFMYVIDPVLSGVAILLIIALTVNNISKNRSYTFRKH